MNVKTRRKLFCIAALLLLQGCSSAFDHKYSGEDLTDSTAGLETQKQRAFTRYNTAFLGRQVAYSAKQQHLLEKHVEFHSEIPVPLSTLLTLLSAQTRNSFRIDDQLPGKPDEQPEMAAGGSVIRENRVSFSGTFEEFMRYLSALYDVTVSLTDDNLLLVKVYNTYAIKLDYFGANNYNTGLDLSGNAATSGGVTGKAESSFQSTFWEDVTAITQRYVSSGVYNLFRDTGVLTFSGRPSEYSVLTRILKDYKQTSSKQFVITYKVFILDRKKLRTLGGEAGLTFKKGGTIFNLNGGLVESPAGDISLGTGFGRLAVAAKLDALYSLTGSKVLQSGTMLTRNNTPVPLNLTDSRNYVSGITTTLSDQIGGFSSSVSTATVTTGTSMILTPRVLSDGRVQITSAYTKKNLVSIDVFPQGATGSQNQVQLPSISTTELFSTVDVTPGTLIIAGRYEMQADADDQGARLLGGRFSRNESSNTVVMAVGIDYYSRPFEEGR